jgi:two-component system, chemotaxis family, protein-glutamate methylesterase/glutaminase
MGGLLALQTLLAGLPSGLAASLAIVQHRGKDPGQGLAKLLQQSCALPVCEPDDKETIRTGHVYLAPADYHLLIERGRIALSTGEQVQRARPSIDVLFESAAEAYGAQVLAVVLTGASADGALGAVRVKALGGRVVVQEPATAESGVMPRAAIAATQVDKVLPLAEIATFLAAICTPHGDATG